MYLLSPKDVLIKVLKRQFQMMLCNAFEVCWVFKVFKYLWTSWLFFLVFFHIWIYLFYLEQLIDLNIYKLGYDRNFSFHVSFVMYIYIGGPFISLHIVHQMHVGVGVCAPFCFLLMPHPFQLSGNSWKSFLL